MSVHFLYYFFKPVTVFCNEIVQFLWLSSLQKNKPGLKRVCLTPFDLEIEPALLPGNAGSRLGQSSPGADVIQQEQESSK